MFDINSAPPSLNRIEMEISKIQQRRKNKLLVSAVIIASVAASLASWAFLALAIAFGGIGTLSLRRIKLDEQIKLYSKAEDFQITQLWELAGMSEKVDRYLLDIPEERYATKAEWQFLMNWYWNEEGSSKMKVEYASA